MMEKRDVEIGETLTGSENRARGFVEVIVA